MRALSDLCRSLSRQRRKTFFWSVLGGASAGGFALAAASLLVPPLRGFGNQSAHVLWGCAFGIVVGLVAAAVAACAVRYAPRDLLHEADVACELKDRLASADEFGTSDLPLAPVLREQALALAPGVDARRVCPVRYPRSAYWALGSVALLLVLSQWDHYPAPAAGLHDGLLSDDATSALAKLIEEKRWKQRDDEIARELGKLAALLKDPRPTRKEALAEIARLTEFLKARKNRSRVNSAELRKAGASLTRSDLAIRAGRSLKEGRFRQAPKDMKALGQKMRDLKGAPISNAQFDKLAQAWRQATAHLSSRGLREAFGKAAGKMQSYDRLASAEDLQALAEMLEGLAERLECDEELAEAMEELRELERRIAEGCGDCKGDGKAKAFMRRPGEGDKPGACAGKGDGRGLSSLFSQGAGRGDLRAGRGTTKNFQGEQTRTDGGTEDDQVDALKNPGKRFVTTIVTDNDGSRSQLSEREVFVKLQRMAQEAMVRENVPLGYRRYVVKYFELIRPHDEPAGDETAPETR
ncbi:MAG: hypothetical protein ACYTKD_09240 [Planctomycetota bacterium]|jgi:hypothetical protein